MSDSKKCVITVYGIDVDVAEVYRARGFIALPPTLTMSAFDLRHYGKVPANYSLHRSTPLNAPAIGDNEAAPVQHGDEFLAVPPANMGFVGAAGA